MEIYTADGRRVRVITDRIPAPGAHGFNLGGQDDGGRWMPTGVLLLRLETADRTAAEKLALIRQDRVTRETDLRVDRKDKTT